MGKAYSNDFNTLLYSGKWANAKLWLLKNRNHLPIQQYYIKHLQVCYFLNEQELCKVYCDSLAATPGFSTSNTSRAAYHLLLSKYYQYHLKADLAVYHGKQSVAFSAGTDFSFLRSMSLVRLANAIEYKHPAMNSLSLLTAEASNVLTLSEQLPDSLFIYKARIKQTTALLYFDRLKNNPNSVSLYKPIVALLNESNRILSAHYAQHPIIAQNYICLGELYVNKDIDKAIAYYKLAEKQMVSINDGSHGIYIYLSASLFNQVSRAYEIKYQQTSDPDYLNKAIIWAKRIISLDRLKQQYEGFHIYRRYIDHHYPPAPERVASLYLALYKLTTNKNYLDFAIRYAEYFRHKPITQIGLSDQTFSVLRQMAEVENGTSMLSENSEDYLDNLITRPEFISRMLEPDQAVIAYFSYSDLKNDSITFLVQCIEQKRQRNYVLSFHAAQMWELPQHLHHAVETGNASEYKQYAHKAYQLLLKPVLSTLNKQVTNLNIIAPAHFKKPLPFEGLLLDEHGHDYASFNYVFDHYSVGYLTSFTHFFSRPHHPVKVNMVNIWNPDYSNTSLAELTEAPVINNAIAKHYHTNVISCSNKNELLRKLLCGDILQVSAHANASFDDLERPRIYTGFPGADSALFDIDLENLATGTQLVIYAACKSNVGNMQHTGIIDGFTRATLTAGAGGTICTMYDVQESLTTEVLKLFYAKLADGYSPAKALHLAKKELKKTHPDPKVWQAYIYTGADVKLANSAGNTSYVVFAVCMLFFVSGMFYLLRQSPTNGF